MTFSNHFTLYDGFIPRDKEQHKTCKIFKTYTTMNLGEKWLT
jgi:hypothetical protein